MTKSWSERGGWPRVLLVAGGVVYYAAVLGIAFISIGAVVALMVTEPSTSGRVFGGFVIAVISGLGGWLVWKRSLLAWLAIVLLNLWWWMDWVSGAWLASASLVWLLGMLPCSITHDKEDLVWAF